MQHPVLILNGPPGSGKDTIASELLARYNVRHLKFAAPLRRMIGGLMNVPPTEIEKLKDQHFPIPRDYQDNRPRDDRHVTWRDVLISGSEDWLKAYFGQDFFGIMMHKELQRPTASDFTVISDGGFAPEVGALIDSMTPKNWAHVCRVRSTGTSFMGDSRKYLYSDEFEARIASSMYWSVFENNIDKDKYPEVFAAQVDKLINDWWPHTMKRQPERKKK